MNQIKKVITVNRNNFLFLEIITLISFLKQSNSTTLKFNIYKIIDYLKNNLNINYVILDDEYQNEYKLFNLNHYKTKTLIGLKEKDLDKITFSNIISKRINYLKYQENKRIKTR